MSTVVVVGNPKPRSRTYEAGVHVATELAGGAPDRVVDLVEFGSALLDWSSAVVGEAVAAVQTADLVVFASPTYKGTYTGLLKLFLDRIGGGSLASVRAVAVMLGADLRHALAPEAFLRPVLAELGASSPTRGLFLLDSDWRTGTQLAEWLPVARAQLGVSA